MCSSDLMLVRATAGKNRSGKLEWHAAYRVDRVVGGPVPAADLADGRRLRRRAAGADVFRAFVSAGGVARVLVGAEADRRIPRESRPRAQSGRDGGVAP